MASDSFTLHVALDDATLLALAHLKDFEARSYPFLRIAMAESLDDLEYQAQEWMWAHFMNPTGPLENAWWKSVYGPWDAELENTSAYGQRRNYGFSGQTDALGRYYPHDPGIAWAENAVANSYPDVERNFQIAFDRTIAGI